MKIITALELVEKMAYIFCKLSRDDRIKHLEEQEAGKGDMNSLAQLAKNLGINAEHKKDQLFIIKE